MNRPSETYGNPRRAVFAALRQNFPGGTLTILSIYDRLKMSIQDRHSGVCHRTPGIMGMEVLYGRLYFGDD